ncbi:PulJ/GspJ family protein [Deinococcus roseus]|uniref:Prepilin-type cleavage/methylation domain-containing protein n=1 Tax=Deinococcus roseus TaxID=392414 RepID=A0ABQ2D1M7_9DEIO|nr:prepilin-type N-terminal cleavage/methylation domain-containing protein [Deinococcus roseus]GGJ35758.1 hypothetical protein GCM10008938_22360 [Deinococcus roseus]
MKHHKNWGFGLFEMLISMALMGIILTALVSIENNTLNYSTQQQDRALKLITLAEVSGYVGDMTRHAVDVKTSMTVNGLSCSISNTANPCFAVMVPASLGTDATRPNKIDAYFLMVYRMEARSSIAAAYKNTNPWADSNTMVLLEYRTTVCQDTTTTACNGITPVMPSTVSNATWYLVGDNLRNKNQAGVAFNPFEYNTATMQLNIRLQVASQLRGKIIYVPGTGPQTFTVRLRNK